ncbi:general transcription factor 3C polypeptide 5 [Lepeophtheirus salmonis]|uniref:general transcription factor 3C polypeptide 5 n=1 Tax=Lepeophtheirus salmonis TaxID=72036 RepID=UPI001AE636C8|nr:general transcription factor 3C polypeptide 5-like [Lepeophtheirus salmonis]
MSGSPAKEKKCPGNLICVEYPGVVANVDKMIETLGGIDNISTVSAELNRRLELRFRPDDIFSKPTCGERVTHGSSSFLLHIAKYKNKVTGETKTVPKFLGNVETNFKFMNLCDFQYLPMNRVTDSNKNEEQSLQDETENDILYEDIYDKVYMKNLESSDWINKKDKEAPLFLPPAAFSRMDVPQDYHYRRESSTLGAENTPYNIIGRTRQRRSHHAIFVTFDVEKVPDKPRDFAVNQLRLKFIDTKEQNIIKDKFAEVPIWAKNTLHAVTKITNEKLKYILPSLGYYFTTGPWRNQWVRFGYDPRKNIESALYQTLDYRVRLQGGARHKVKAKRSYANYLLPYKAMSWSKAKTSIITREVFEENIPKDDTLDKKEEEERLKDIYLFRSGRIPPYRQMFYQFKDLQHEEAQNLIRKSYFSRNSKCNEKSGWFLPGTDQKLRDLLTVTLNEHIAMENKKEFGPEESSNSNDNLEDLVISDEDEEDDDEEEDDDDEDVDVDVDEEGDNPTLTDLNFMHHSTSDDEDSS